MHFAVSLVSDADSCYVFEKSELSDYFKIAITYLNINVFSYNVELCIGNVRS